MRCEGCSASTTPDDELARAVHRGRELLTSRPSAGVRGNAHEIEIWFGVIDGTLYLISGNGPKADWYRNMIAEPEVTVRIDDQTARAPHVSSPIRTSGCASAI